MDTKGDIFPSLAGQGAIAIDCETCDPLLKERGPGYHRGSFIAGISIGTEAGFQGYYPIGHEVGENLDKQKVLGWLKEQLSDDKVPKVGANLIYDLGFLEAAGVPVPGPLHDIQVAEPLLDENRFNYSLEALSKDYLGYGKQDEEMDAFLIANFGRKNPKSNIWRCPPEIVAPYAIGDIDQPLKIFALQKVKLEEQGLWDLFVMESKLTRMLLQMRQHGIRVDLDSARERYDELTKRQENLQKQIGDVEVWAAASIAKKFDDLGLEYPLTPKTKKPSFVVNWLEAHPHPIAQSIVEIRRLDKMRGTFLQGCILEGHTNGRIHCQFNQLKGEGGGTTTGRMSSSQPNLQFIPVRTEEGKKMRAMFLADEGQDAWDIDFSQIEYRLIAHDAAELGLKGAQAVVDEYCSNEKADFHQIIADMTGLARGPAKTINFGLAYGEGIEKLAGQLHLSVEDATRLINQYHQRAPFIRPLSQGCMNTAARKGEITTLLGRRRRFTWWETMNWKTREKTYLPYPTRGCRRAHTHKALNARIQGSAADIMKKCMTDIWESGVLSDITVQLTVHDELVGSMTRDKRGQAALKEVARIMESTVKLRVPLRVDVGTGKSWGDAH